MPRYSGKVKCPGCGKTGEESPRDYANTICWDCEKLLKLGKIKRELDAQDKSRYAEITLPAYKFTLFTQYGKPAESKQALYISDQFGKDIEGSSEALLKAQKEFLETINQGAKKGCVQYSAFDGNHFTGSSYFLTFPQAQAFVAFMVAVADYARRNYEEGLEDGKSLLTGLASGRYSIQEFNDATRRQK